MKLPKLLIGAFAVLSSVVSMAQDLNVTFRSQLQYPGHTCANICGYVDSLGNEYALVGVSTGMSIVDVTNPSLPVEVLAIPNIDNLWKEIKVYGKYAYVTTEGGGGLQIVNLSSLPNTAGVTYHNWAPTIGGTGGGTLGSIHALHIDGHFAYLYGSNLFNGGAIAADLTDPWNPVYAGVYEGTTASYVHDGYVRNDTLYAGHIYEGFFSVVDFTNKAAPVELANQTTPTAFTHNTWLSQNSRVLFTTDENDGSYLTSYDVSNLANIIELDRLQTTPGSGSIVHNTHIINVGGNDYAVTSWYKDGFNITDVGRPHNMVEVGRYDTYSGTGPGFEGDWGVYPYLPSGTIVVSNIDEGLFVFTPTYVRACYLEGMITDSLTGFPISGASIQILSTTVADASKIGGDYATGLPSPGGTYSVTYSKPGYASKTISGLTLAPALVTVQDVALSPLPTYAISGQVRIASTTTGIAGANVSIRNNDFSFSAVTDAMGNFSFPAMYADLYEVTGGKWGYVTSCAHSQTISGTSGPVIIELNPGYYDDFVFNFGWNVSGTASAGLWERGVPVGTFNGPVASNPGIDDSTDCSTEAFVTGNAGGTAGADDVDSGPTNLVSPNFDLSAFTDPYLNFTRWFYNGGGSGSPNDSLTISLNNGSTTVPVDITVGAAPFNSTWVHKSFKISTFLTPTATMKMIMRAVDRAPGHVVEAALDKFYISEGPSAIGITETENTSGMISAYPNPFSLETTIAYDIKDQLSTDARIVVRDVTGRSIAVFPIDKANGTVTLNTAVQSGIYFVNIENGKTKMAPLKIVKMK